ncbi:MAG: hypothetical protein KKG60_02955 [Nanoarchaeota archaeon]|nr:hypothetical protein [Nanoarchaeota archaeon]
MKKNELLNKILSLFNDEKIIRELLPNLDEYMETYKLFEHQLLKGEKLEIKLEPLKHEKDGYIKPNLVFYFTPKRGQKKRIASFSRSSHFILGGNSYILGEILEDCRDASE